MNIKVIGCGTTAASLEHALFNQCFLISETYYNINRTMIIDFGYQIPLALNYHNIDIQKIDDVFISHMHADHAAGLEILAYKKYDWISAIKHRKPPENFCEFAFSKAARIISKKNILNSIWKNCLSGSLEIMEGFKNNANLSTFFEPCPVSKSFIWQEWEFILVPREHIKSQIKTKYSYGLFIRKTGHKSLYIAIDCRHDTSNRIMKIYREADIIIHDTELFPEELKSNAHPNYFDLIKLPDEIKQKIWLSHYQDFKCENKDLYGNYLDWDVRAKSDGFCGFLKPGMKFEV